jgi:hypothetical protein
MNEWKNHALALLAASLSVGACSSDFRAYDAPSGNVLRVRVLSTEQISPEQVKVSVCYQLPSESDWILGRLFGDVTLSDDQGKAVLDDLELLALSDSPPRRCDRLFFSRPGGFPPGDYSLTIVRLAATIPEQPDWAALQTALADVAPGLLIERLPGQAGLAFGLIEKPSGMTDAEAADLVVGLAEPVLIGPWVVPVEIRE